MNIPQPQLSISQVIRFSAVGLGCLLGADALARLGTLQVTSFEVGEVLVALATIVVLVPSSYRLAAVGAILGVAAILGVGRTVNVLAHAYLDGEANPAPLRAYLLRALLYASYVGGFFWVREVARKRSGRV